MLKCLKKLRRDFDSNRIQVELYNNCQEAYNKPTQIFSKVLGWHAPIKQKVVRGNQASFVTKDLSQIIMMKSKAKNEYVKWTSRQNFLTFKKTKNKCTSINKKVKKKDDCKETTKNSVITTKKFWIKLKPFLTNREYFPEDQISIEINGQLVSNEKILTEIFTK